MKRFVFLLITVLMPTFMMAQNKGYVLPGKGNINVENLNKKIDLNMDISQLSLSELKVLRNAFDARQGVIFEEGEMRSIYQTTSWYDSLMWERVEVEYENEPYKTTYSAEEKRFIDKIKQREALLMQDNFKPEGGGIVNTDNIVNIYQLEQFDGKLKEKLQKNGFAIVQDDYDQLFQVYENNDYHDFPSFVTTDLYLQLFHVYFDGMLQLVETESLYDDILQLCKDMKVRLAAQAVKSQGTLRDATLWDLAFFDIAINLLSDRQNIDVAPQYRDMVRQEIKNINVEKNNFSEFLDYKTKKFTYSLFRPRGHYTKSDRLKKYFKAMMWLQTAPFDADNQIHLLRAAVISNALEDYPECKQDYKKLVDPITFLMGEPDNISILQVCELMKQNNITIERLAQDKDTQAVLKELVEKKAAEQTKVKPKNGDLAKAKVNFMPQRYFPDAEVLINMIDEDNRPTKRDVSKGLDYFAAIGWQVAENILINEMNEDKNWEQYLPQLNKMKKRMTEVDWNANIANQWVKALGQINVNDDAYPYFMKTPEWGKKNLNAALASWAELKHDAILYAKQPMMAECGDGGIDPPIVKGYVEPNIKFWNAALELLEKTEAAFSTYDVASEITQQYTGEIREQLQFLINISNKELRGEEPDQYEYSQIEIIGANFEYLTTQLLTIGQEGYYEWRDIEGADKKVAIVADVLTSNAINNPNPSILYEAIGPVNEIYVVVEINGCLYLTRGAVFSYREFKRDVNAPRLTDEEWQKDLLEMPNEGMPKWMEPIVIPKEGIPTDNERVFYSSGC